jgi:hypothetical protein
VIRVRRTIMSSVPFNISAFDSSLLPKPGLHSKFYGNKATPLELLCKEESVSVNMKRDLGTRPGTNRVDTSAVGATSSPAKTIGGLGDRRAIAAW